MRLIKCAFRILRFPVLWLRHMLGKLADPSRQILRDYDSLGACPYTGGSAFLMRMPFPEPSIFQGKKWNSIMVRPAGPRPVRNIDANLAFALKFRTVMGPWLGIIAAIFKYRLLCWITVHAHNSLVLSFGRRLLKKKMLNAPDNTSRAKFLVLPFLPFSLPNPGSITWDTRVGHTESQSRSVFPN